MVVREPRHGTERQIFLALMVPALVLGLALSVLNIFMKLSVNLDLPEERQLSWWSKDYFVVERTYAQQNPESILPQLNRAGFYLMIALGIAASVSRFWPG